MAKPPGSSCVELDFIGESMWGGGGASILIIKYHSSPNVSALDGNN